MSRILTIMPAAVLALAVLAGCGTDAAPSAAPADDKASATADPQSKRRQMEAMRADCMKGKGFKYAANVPAPVQRTPEEVKLRTGDYDAMAKEREKYGFGVFAGHVYPERKEVGMLADPNEPIVMALSETQRKVWVAADETCYIQAYSKFSGRKVTSGIDAFNQMNTMSKQLRGRELNGDAELVRLAGAFGECLRNKGVKVTSFKPTEISSNGQDAYEAMATKIGKEQNPDAKGELVIPDLTADRARPYLADEIRSALLDLECGKDFYPAYKSKEWAISQQVDAAFGVDEGLFGS